MTSVSYEVPVFHQTTNLPLELVLVILEFAARTWIDVHPRWTASLQLISRTARAAIEPIIYRVFIVQGNLRRDSGGVLGLPDIERLAQILANDAPRIHHLVLGEAALAGLRTPVAPTRSVARLSVITRQDVPRLPALAQPLNAGVNSNKTELVCTGLALVGNLRFSVDTWEHRRFWRSNLATIRGASSYDTIGILAVDNDGNRPGIIGRGDKWFHIELVNQMALSTLILNDIAGLLRSSLPELRSAQVVIVCPADYTSPYSLRVDETLQLLDASRTLPAADETLEAEWCAEQHLPIELSPQQFRMLRKSRVHPDVLYSRVHVSHAVWGCDGPGWVGLWYGRAVERGDAWDKGRLLRRFVAHAGSK